MARLLSILVLILLALAPPGARAQAPRAPQGAEILLQGRLLPPPGETRAWLERLRGYALFERGLELFQEETGLNLEADVLSCLEGTAVVAILRVGEESPLSIQAGRQRLITRWKQERRKLRRVQEAVSSYVEEKGAPPDSLAELDSFLEEVGADVEGLEYRRVGDSWTLKCSFPKKGDLAAHSTAPGFDAEGVEFGAPPQDLPLNLTLALRVTDAPRALRSARHLLDQGFGPNGGSAPLHLESSPGWLILTDNPQTLASMRSALKGNARVPEGLARMLGRVPERPESFLFLDVAGVVEHWKDLPVQDPAAWALLRSLKGAILATYATRDRVLLEGFLAVDLPAGHPLRLPLEGPTDQRLDLASQVPWSVSSLDILRVDALWEGLEAAGRTWPETGLLKARLLHEVEARVGLNLEKDLLEACAGEVAVNVEMVDVVSAAMLARMDRRAGREGGPPSSGSGLPSLGMVPITLLVDLKPGPSRQALLDRLEEAVGPQAADAGFRQSADRSLAYAVHGDTLVLAVGPSLRLARHAIKALDGEVRPLVELDSARHFRSGQTGRLLFFTHAKTDALYSVLKGVLLLLGAEFRPEADHAGLWRDAYGALSLEPGGVRWRSGFYATAQVP